MKAGDGWEVRARVRNTGSGTAAVEIAAASGERFPKKRTAENALHESRTTVTLGAGERADVVLRCDFEPKRLVVDPDVHLLMLERSKAEMPLKPSAGAGSLTLAQ